VRDNLDGLQCPPQAIFCDASDGGSPAIDASAWLNTMRALGYTTAEQRSNHRDDKAGATPDATEITFF